MSSVGAQHYLGANYKLLVVKAIVAMACMVAISFFISHAASASMATNSRLYYGNAANYCNAGHTGSSGPWAKGMVWLSNQSDYYSEEVRVNTNATSQRVSIRGAVNACNTTWPGARRMYAVDITTSYLSGLSSRTLYRGLMPAAGNFRWTSQGSRVYGTLNVRNVARCSSANYSSGYASARIYVDIYRRQQQRDTRGNITHNSSIGLTERVPVFVRRVCPTYNYTLSPQITGTRTSGSSDEQTAITPVVNNNGSTSSRSSAWEVTRFIVRRGTTVPSGANNTATPVSHFGNGAQVIANGTRVFPLNPTTVGASTQNIPALDVGDRLCFGLSVRPRAQADSRWAHSTPYCVTVAKSPKVQLWGGSLVVGRSFAGTYQDSTVQTSLSSSVIGGTRLNFGSWSEYGILAAGRVDGMASGSGLQGGSDGAQPEWSNLTYANSSPSAPCTLAQFGCYRLTDQSIPDVSTMFPTTDATTIPSGQTRSISELANLAVASPAGDSRGGVLTVGSGTTTTSLTISGGTLGDSGQRGRWIVINAPNTDVTIANNISYTSDGLSSVADIPQLIIIARNILIRHSVTQVDAWLIARGGSGTVTGANGYITTCSTNNSGGALSNTAALTASLCDDQLRINGPVMANTLYLRRTAGSNPSGGASGASAPAEVINLRPDAYLWLQNRQQQSTVIRGAGTLELPPRF